MSGLTRNARPLLSFVNGKRHAKSEDHEPDNERAPDSDSDDSDHDNDTSNLGKLPGKKPNRLRVPPRTVRTTSSPVVPAKRAAEPDEPLDNPSFTSSSSQSKPPRKTFSKKPSFTARSKVARQHEKPGWAHPSLCLPDCLTFDSHLLPRHSNHPAQTRTF